MKRTINILILFIFLSLSGCWTKIYLGKEKAEPEPVLSDEMVMSSRAIDPTEIPAGGTWGTVRGIINTNFDNINETLDSVEVTLELHGDTLEDHRTDIDLKLAIADTAAMLAPYALTSELGEAGILLSDVQNEIEDSLNVLRPLKLSVSDTAAMLDTYAKLSDLSEGGISISAVQDEIADSLNALRLISVVGDGTKGPFFDGSQDGGQMLYFYGNNGFYTSIQGGAPVANRSYRLPIAALPSAGTTSLMNIDEYGNMGFVASTSKISTVDSTGISPGSYTSGYTFQQGMMNKVQRADSLTLYVTPKQLSDSINANLGSASGFTPNGGSLTLSGGDALTFETGGNFTYTLPQTSGGTLMLMSEIQQAIADSINARIGNGVQLLDVAVAKADSTGGPGHYASHNDMTTGLAGKQNSNAVLSSLAGLSNSSGVLTNNGSGTLSWAASGGGEMIYPGSGVPISTGSAWGTSVSSVSATELGYVDGVTSAIQTQINSKAPLSITLNPQTGTSYTLVLSDAYKIVTMTNANANTLTIPLNSSVAFPVGTQITVVQNGAGETTIAATGGVTLNSADSKKDLRVQYSSCTLIKVATDTWLLIGDIEA